jgi:hypothetical protein
MGSKGKKARKPSHSQHLPKVGTKAERDRIQHEERSAILDTMGLGGSGKGTRTTFWVIGAILLVGALGGLIILTVALS